MKILAYGEVLWDFIEGDKYFGGAPFNFAAHVVKCGGESTIISSVGNDKLGRDALDQINLYGVSPDFVQKRNDKVTGKVMVLLKEGQPTYHIKKDVAYDYIDINQIDIELLSNYDAFYFGTLTQRGTDSRRALYKILDQKEFKTVFYDVNLRRDSYTKEIIEESLRRSTIVKMNDDEVIELGSLLYGIKLTCELFIERVKNDYPKIQMIIVTEGAKGCSIYTKEMMTEVASQAVQVQDTVGAGDAFCAAFITSFLQSGDPEKAAQIGNKIGGYVASQKGAIPEYSKPIIEEVSQFPN